jgi:hydrogenase maturation factor
MPALPVGKLPPQLLQRLLSAHASDDPRVIVGPQVGEDAAVLDIGDRYLVATADPITFATDELGWYALHVNANDLAVRGARPLWFLATVLLPEGGATELGVGTYYRAARPARAGCGSSAHRGDSGPGAPDRLQLHAGRVGKGYNHRRARPGDVLLLTRRALRARRSSRASARPRPSGAGCPPTW